MPPALRLILLYAAGGVAGWGLQSLNFPLPWMLGPLLLTGALYATGRVEEPVPVLTRPVGQMIVALQIGLYFTPTAVRGLVDLTPVLLAVSAQAILAAGLVAFVTARLSGRPMRPAFLATAPFSPVEATVIAEAQGWSPGPIILAQTLRIGIAVMTFPVALYLIDGWPDRSSMPGAAARDTSLMAIALMLGLGLAAALAFKTLKFNNPWFMGPLTACALASGFGLFATQGFPLWVIGAAQVVLGTWLGSAFRRAVFIEASQQLKATLAATFGYLALVTLGALALSALFGLPWEVMVLGSAPGGVTEMALTARFLEIDVTLVTGMQMARILILMTAMRPILALLARLEG